MDARLTLPDPRPDRRRGARIRNAGGVVTDDEIRSLAICQRLLGTRDTIPIHHTDCGRADLHRRRLQTGRSRPTSGTRPSFAPEAFTDATRTSGSRCAHPGQPVRDAQGHSLRGFVYDVATGKLNEVTL